MLYNDCISNIIEKETFRLAGNHFTQQICRSFFCVSGKKDYLKPSEFMPSVDAFSHVSIGLYHLPWRRCHVATKTCYSRAAFLSLRNAMCLESTSRSYLFGGERWQKCCLLLHSMRCQAGSHENGSPVCNGVFSNAAWAVVQKDQLLYASGSGLEHLRLGVQSCRRELPLPLRLTSLTRRLHLLLRNVYSPPTD